MKKILSLVLAGTMCLSASCASMAESTTAEAKTTLVNAIANKTADYIKKGDLSVYSDMNWTSVADTLPASFDLRDRGVVPEVRSQLQWGNCWSFASIAASEISQLSKLKVTVDEFREATGVDMDLSERHLAWFGTGHLPTLDQYAEGEYPYDAAQAGEGLWSQLEEISPNQAHFSGGVLGYASSVFANGVGPELESEWPYNANDGTASSAADWSIPEENRYKMEAEMLNSSILPSPAQVDENGDYVYNAAGTEAIKQELLEGRGVSIMYHSDLNMAPDAFYSIAYDQMVAEGLPEAVAEIQAGLTARTLAPEDVTPEQKHTLMAYFLLRQGVAEEDITEEAVDQAIEEYYDDFVDQILNPQTPAQQAQPEQTEEEKAAKEAEDRELMEKLGMDYDEEANKAALTAAANAGVYMNADTYAQYVDNRYATPNHGVTVVGWDDNYAVSNFPADHQPPAPGAWICRNSWGSGYGDNGYFYLSYYDRTISFAETFEFVFDQNAINGVNIDTYDNMQASAISSVKSETPVYMANVFPLDQDYVLSYISVMTTDLNASVTANVYLLNENYTSPTDGVLLETVTDEYKFAGYHRIDLDYDYQLPAGSVISVVERQKVEAEDGTRYTLSYTNGESKEYAEIAGGVSWKVGIINKGESFVSVDNQWYDWSDIVNEVKATNDTIGNLVEFDNLNIKAYLYTVEGVENAHNFTDLKVYNGGEALICEDCGEMMIIVK